MFRGQQHDMKSCGTFIMSTNVPRYQAGWCGLVTAWRNTEGLGRCLLLIDGHAYLYLHKIFARMPTTERFSKLATWDPYTLETPGAALGSPGTTKEVARAWAHGQARAGPKDPTAPFVVPGDPKAALGSPAYECWSQVANLKTLLWRPSLLKSPCR